MCSLPSSAPSAGQGWRLDATPPCSPLPGAQPGSPSPAMALPGLSLGGQSLLSAGSHSPLPGPLSAACHSLCLPTQVQRQHILKQSEHQLPVGCGRKGRGAKLSLLTVLLSPGRVGDLGVTRGSHGEEASNEFLFKFFIPGEQASLGRPRSRCAASPATERAPAGMSSPGYGLMA